ncbi:MAG: hypothetical protein ACYDEA_00660 [Candidatus Dormibacteria bacterium]
MRYTYTVVAAVGVVGEGLGEVVAPADGVADGEGVGRDGPSPQAVAATITPRTLAMTVAAVRRQPSLALRRYRLAPSAQLNGPARRARSPGGKPR